MRVEASAGVFFDVDPFFVSGLVFDFTEMFKVKYITHSPEYKTMCLL